jgi:hypothetical protein
VMTRYPACAFLMASALLVSSACQRARVTRFAAEFAVEIKMPAASNGALPRDEYVIVPDFGLASMELSGDSLCPLSHSAPPVTIKLDFTVEHHSVVTAVYTLPLESDPLRYSDGHKQRLGGHSGRLNEIVELKELESLGYRPLVLRVVGAKPDHPVHPSIVSNVPSIQPRLVDEDRNGYTLSLRNVSRRGVVSYTISEGGGFSLASVSRRQPLIAPGAEWDERIEPLYREVVVAAALFSDGSHEGDSDAAVQLESGQIGYDTQERRAIPIIDRIIRDPALDENVRVARIKDELTKLSNDPDDSAMRTMQSHFPDFPADVVRNDLTNALYLARVNLWSEVYGYMHSSGEYPPPVHPPLLADWLRRRR